MNSHCKLKTAFEDRGFVGSLSDPCVFISKEMIILVYVYDCILISARGGMQQYGVNYWETYSPTVNRTSVRFLMIVAQVLELDTQAIDFVLAFPQAELEVPVYMELPTGMDLSGHGKDSSKYLLKLKRSLYESKQASLNSHCKLKTAFEDRGFVESLSDPCVFISKEMIILVYVDDCILISKKAFFRSKVYQFFESWH